jgi:hypothetical protein
VSSWTAARRAPKSGASLPRHAADAPPGPRLPSHTPREPREPRCAQPSRDLHRVRMPSPQAAASMVVMAGAAQRGPPRPGMAPGIERRHGGRHTPEAAGVVPAASGRISASRGRRCQSPDRAAASTKVDVQPSVRHLHTAMAGLTGGSGARREGTSQAEPCHRVVRISRALAPRPGVADVPPRNARACGTWRQLDLVSRSWRAC